MPTESTHRAAKLASKLEGELTAGAQRHVELKRSRENWQASHKAIVRVNVPQQRGAACGSEKQG
jgi:hypothetical protein